PERIVLLRRDLGIPALFVAGRGPDANSDSVARLLCAPGRQILFQLAQQLGPKVRLRTLEPEQVLPDADARGQIGAAVHCGDSQIEVPLRVGDWRVHGDLLGETNSAYVHTIAEARSRRPHWMPCRRRSSRACPRHMPSRSAGVPGSEAGLRRSDVIRSPPGVA